MSKILKWILIIIGLGGALFIGYVLYIGLTFSFPFDDGKFYSTKDSVDNYNAKTEEINELKRYVNTVISANKSVDIEFDGNKRLRIFHVFDNGVNDSNWDLNISSSKVDALLEKLGWTRQTLKTLKEKLNAANCISIKNGEPCNIGFQRSGMGKYYYNIFDKPVPDSLKSSYNDSCTYILYGDKVVLEYGGGAIGPQCFPTK